MIETARFLIQYIDSGNWLFAHYIKMDEEGKESWRGLDLFQRFIFGMGIDIWHLVEE